MRLIANTKTALAILLAVLATDARSQGSETSPDRAPIESLAKTVEPPVDCRAPDTSVLGTSRVIPISPAATPLHVGLKTYPQTLALARNEVVLTFDDGPFPETTKKVLAALKRECVRATFFLIGRNAKQYPELVRREVMEGHTVGYHSNTHPSVTLRGMDDKSGLGDIEDGIAAVERAEGKTPAVRFFRFPGFADSAFLLHALDERHDVVFGTDLWAADWLKMTPAFELKRVMDLLDDPRRQGGIILFHDTKASTAAMLPDFLRALKAKGYKIVHLVSSDGTEKPPLALARDGWTSETDRIIAHVWPKIMPGAKQTIAPDRDERGREQTDVDQR